MFFGGAEFYVRSENCLIPVTAMILIYFASAIVLIFAFVVPAEFWLFGALAVIYSAAVLFDQPQNNMGILIFITGILVLALTGFFRKKGKIKTALFTLLYVVLIFSELRFGLKIFVSSLISKSLFFFTLVVIILLSFRLALGKLIFTGDKILDLSEFPDLTLRDAEWIELILKETKYDTIARLYGLTEGTVKNNFGRIYRIIGVRDRIHFMSVYGAVKSWPEVQSRFKSQRFSRIYSGQTKEGLSFENYLLRFSDSGLYAVSM